MKKLTFKYTLLYIIFFVYPFTALQIKYYDFSIPLSDLFGMILSLIFVYQVIGKASFHQQVPIINRIGIKYYFIFLVVAGLSICNTSYITDSIKYWFRFPLFAFIIYFISIGSILIWHGKSLMPKLYMLLCVSTLICSIISILATIYRFSTGDFLGITVIPYLTNNHKTIALSIAPNLPLLLAYQKNANSRSSIIAKLTIILSVISIILSFSKIAWAAVILTFVAWGTRHFGKLIYLKFVFLLSVVAVGLPAIVYAFKYFSNIPDIVTAELGRFFLAIIGINMFLEHPLIGCGIGTFSAELKQYEDAFIKSGVPTLADLDAHGLIFKVSSETGLIGLIFFLIFFGTIYYTLYKLYKMSESIVDKKFKNYLFGSMISFLILVGSNMIGGTDTYTCRFWFLLTFAAVHYYWCNFNKSDLVVSRKDKGRFILKDSKYEVD